MKYYSIAEMSKKLNVSAQTLRNYRYYSREQLNKVLGIKEKPRKIIGYCRVSSNKQKDELKRKVENMIKELVEDDISKKN